VYAISAPSARSACPATSATNAVKITVGNQAYEASSICGQQVANRLGHRACNVRVMHIERIHEAILSHRGWNLTCKKIGMQLKKLHLWEGPDSIDTSCQQIVIQVQLSQVVQLE
jgi:hypothetical protein